MKLNPKNEASGCALMKSTLQNPWFWSLEALFPWSVESVTDVWKRGVWVRTENSFNCKVICSVEKYNKKIANT